MEDIKLPTEEFEINGKTYTLCCNFNVLYEVQKMNNGVFPDTARGDLMDYFLILAGMLNAYAKKVGWEERYTPEMLGEMCLIPDVDDVNMVRDLVKRSTYKQSEHNKELENQKNLKSQRS